MLSPEKELSTLSRRSLSAYTVPFSDLARSIINGRPTDKARQDLADTITQSMTLADLTGRRRLWMEFDAVAANMKPEEMFQASPVVPHVPFEEAVTDLMTRDPRLAVDAAEVARLYRERHAFALVQSAELALTDAVQRAVATLADKGVAAASGAMVLAEVGDFTRSYASTVFRTNVSTAYNAGRFKQAQEPAVRVVLPAMERFSVRDSAVRSGRKQDHGENHLAAHGLLADSMDPIWRTHSPPSGYKCRCGTRMVSIGELRRRGLIEGGKVLRYEPPGFRAFRANPAFASKPPMDAVYGGGAMV